MKVLRSKAFYIIVAAVFAFVTSIVFYSLNLAKMVSNDINGQSDLTISTVSDLKIFRDNVNAGNNYAGATITLNADLDLQGVNFNPIGSNSAKPFAGNFDGNGHTIDNVYIYRTAITGTTNCVGFFGYTQNASIKNLTLKNVKVYVSSSTAGTSASSVASFASGIVGRATDCEIENCHVSGYISSISGAGGTAASGKVGGSSGNVYVAGIVGGCRSTNVSKCSFVGTTYSSAGNGGNGAAGTSSSPNGTAGGNVGATYHGGIVAHSVKNTDAGGSNAVTTISQCYVDAVLNARSGRGGTGGTGAAVNKTRNGGNGGANGTMFVGGIAGASAGTNIEDCYAVGKMDLLGTVMGIPGNGGAYNSVYGTTGKVGSVKTQAAGGIAGYYGLEDGYIKNCYTKMDMLNTNWYYFYNQNSVRLAGVVGIVEGSLRNFSMANIVSLGQNYEGDSNFINNGLNQIACFGSVDVKSTTQNNSSNIKYNANATLVNNNSTVFAPYNLNSAKAISDTDALDFANVFDGFNQTIWQIDSAKNNGLPTLRNVKYEERTKTTVNVRTREELVAIAKRVNSTETFHDLTINILADIDVGVWTPLCLNFIYAPAKLTINGNNHVLKNMTVNQTGNFKGFIGYAREVEIKDLYIEDPVITGNGGNYVGALIGIAGWTANFSNCHVTQGTSTKSQGSIVTGGMYVGGLAGTVLNVGNKGKIVNCSSTVNVRCATASLSGDVCYAGGLLGELLWTTVEKCYATGNVTCDSNTKAIYYAGSLVGGLTGPNIIKDCFTTGDVTVGSEGAFIGYMWMYARGTQILNCYSAGNITYTYNASTITTRVASLCTRIMTTNVTLKNNAMITPKISYPNKNQTVVHLGQLFCTQNAYRICYAPVATSSETAPTLMSKYPRSTFTIDGNYYNVGREVLQGTATATAKGTNNANFIDSSGRSAASYATMQTENFWQNTINFDMENVWDWNADLNNGFPTLKSNPYYVPGEGGHEIEISTASELQAFSTSVNAGNLYKNKTVILTDDIDLSGINFTPIGKSAAISFQGIFDGQGHTISNLMINKSTTFKGLFGAAVGATIKNLTIENPKIVSTPYDYAAALLGGGHKMTITNCHVKGGTIESGGSNIGGIVGNLANGGNKVEDCSVTGLNGNPTIIKGGGRVGGIVGLANNESTTSAGVEVRRCFSTATIIGTANAVGGIVGTARGGIYEDCYATGSVTAIGTLPVGGILGYAGVTPTTVSNCMVVADILQHGTDKYSAIAGGIVGLCENATTVTNCLVNGNINSGLTCTTAGYAAMAGGVIGFANVDNVKIGGCAVISDRITASNKSSVVSSSNSNYYRYSSPMANGYTAYVPTAISGMNNFYNSDCKVATSVVSSPTHTDSVTCEAHDRTEFFGNDSLYVSSSFGLGWDFNNVWELNLNENNGLPYLKALGEPIYEKGSRYNPIEITDKYDFYDIKANNVNGFNYYGYYLKQTADINLTDAFAPIGTSDVTAFGGTYDGQGFKLIHPVVRQSASCVGVFGYTKIATLKNIFVVNPDIAQTGSNTLHSVGGLVGYSDFNLTIENCAVVGGSVSGTGWRAGGLVGRANNGYSYITNSYSTANVTGGGNVGGIAGYLTNTVVEKCYATGDVIANMPAGSRAGGLIGLMQYECKVTNCYARGNVQDASTTEYSMAGGLVGESDYAGNVIENCYATGEVFSRTTISNTSSTNLKGAYAAGIVSYVNTASTTLSNCISLSKTIGATAANSVYQQAAYFAGGGKNTKAIANNLHYLPATLTSIKGGDTTVSAASGAEMAETDVHSEKFYRSTMNWDFDNVWMMREGLNDGLPTLRGMMFDQSLLEDILAQAKAQSASDWNEETFADLQIAIKHVEDNLSVATEEEKYDLIIMLQLALDGLRADKTGLQALYDQVNLENVPYKLYYKNFAVVESNLANVKDVLDDNSNKFRNSDVLMIKNALATAVKNLVVDKTLLNVAIQEANEKNQDDYLEAEWMSVVIALQNAIKVNNTVDATAKEVAEATENLENAMAKLQVNKALLVKALIDTYSCLGAKATYDEKTNKLTVDSTNQLAESVFEDYVGFKSALDIALEILDTPDPTANEVTIAIFNLNVELNNLEIDKKTLQELFNQASLIQQRYYTDESYAQLKTAMDEADKILAATAEKDAETGEVKFVDFYGKVKTAEENLQNALDGLVINKVALKEAIDAAEAEDKLGDTIYDDVSIAKLRLELAEAKVIYDKADATTTEIETATKELNEAILNLHINVKYLQSLVTQADLELAEDVKIYYTTTTVDILEINRDAAKVWIDDSTNWMGSELSHDSGKIAEIKQLTKDLQDSLDGLVFDRTILTKLIDRVNNPSDADYIDPTNYAAESIEHLKTHATEAQSLLDASDTTNSQLIVATKNLKKAIDGLKPNKDALAALVGEVSTWKNVAYRQDNDGNWILDDNGDLKVFIIYSTASWDMLQAKLTAANDVLISSLSTLEEVNTAKAALEKAIEDLEIDTEELELRIEKAEKLLAQQEAYTDASIAVLREKTQAAKDAVDNIANMNIDEAQAVLDALVSAINGLQVSTKAIDALIKQAEDLEKYKQHFESNSYDNLVREKDFVKDLLKTEGLSAEDVEGFITLMQEALDNLIIITDALDLKIDEAENLLVDFIVDTSMQPVSIALADAKQMLERQFNFEEFIEKYETLTTAIANIQLDRAAYESFVNEAKLLLKRDYEEASKEELQTQLGIADTLLANETIAYADAAKNISDIKAAIAALIANREPLSQRIDQIKEEMDGVYEQYDENKIASTYYTEASYQNLLDQLEAAQDVLNNPSSTLDQLEQALIDLNAVYAALVMDKTELATLISSCDAYEKDFFEENSYNALQNVLVQANLDVANDKLTLDEYMTSLNNLQTAIDNLQFLTTALEELLAQADLIVKDDYTLHSYNNLISYVQAAAEFDYADFDIEAEGELEGYRELCENLAKALNDLVYIADLATEIENLETFLTENDNSDGKYTTNSYFAVQNLLAEAKALYERIDPTRAEIEAMIARLQTATDLLVDVSELKGKIDEIELLMQDVDPSDYTAKSYAEFAEAIANAKAKLVDATEEEIDEIVTNLQGKFDALVYMKDARDLLTSESEFAETEESKYTAESWADYKSAVDALQVVVKNGDSLDAEVAAVTREEFEAAIKAVEDAKAALELAPVVEEGLFEIVDTNTTFKFVDESNTAVELGTHVFDPENPLYLTNIALGDTLADILAQFKNSGIKAFDKAGNEITDLSTKIATAMQLRLYKDDIIIDEVTLVVKGDVNGDGKINMADMVGVDAHAKGAKPLSGAYKLASDVNSDGKINMADMVKIDAHAKGAQNLHSGLSVKGGEE